MKRIYKSNKILTVPSGAYKEIFKGNGWKEVGEKTSTEENESFKEDVETEDDDFSVDITEDETEAGEDLAYLFEKPLNTFTQEEAAKFAKAYGLTIEGMSRKNAMKVIAEYIEANK